MYTNILAPRKQGRLNDKSVYIIISFLLHYSSCQNHHPNYKHNTSKLENEAMYTNYTYHKNKDDLMTNMFISLYPFYFIILAAKTSTQITNTDIILPNLKTRLCIQIILVPQKQRRLNDESVYIIISFLLHYSGCQNRHANYKYRHNTSKLENEAMYTNYTCTTETKTT